MWIGRRRALLVYFLITRRLLRVTYQFTTCFSNCFLHFQLRRFLIFLNLFQLILSFKVIQKSQLAGLLLHEVKN